ncbi:MAG TPA: FlgD immunoglobulin-like domain containing protein [Candidatus Krumholzibacteria bacterium]|nr:FlgD immunoglobulin-like domain containing protein [Candidatus Krumholzibacteria bacterium]
MLFRSAALGTFLLALTGLAPSRLYATGVDLVGFLDPSPMVNYVDCWGWNHPSNGRSYALVGNNASGLHIIDVSDPFVPFQVAAVTSVPRYDIKTRGNLVYTVDGLPNGAGGILNISNPSAPVPVGSFPGGHNLWIDTKGFMYVALPGLTCYDLNETPANPQFVWRIESPDGHDAYVDGDRLFDFRGYAGTFIYDVADRRSPQLVGSIVDPSITFHHEGRLTIDKRYLFLCDEFAVSPNPDITVWDLQNIASPVRVGAIHDPTATVHYCYVVGNTLAVAYFTAGFKLYDISNPLQPALVDQYDTSPKSGEGIFEGAYGCYPFGPGGTIYVSDRPNGLFVFQFDFATGIERVPNAGVAVGANMPNPFGASTSIPYRLSESADATLSVFDARGARIRTLRAGFTLSGEHAAEWDGRDDAGRAVASGVYFCKLSSRGREATHKLILVR